MGWLHCSRIEVGERAGVQTSAFPVKLRLDTVSLVASGAIRPDGTDLRVVAGGQRVPCQAEGLGSEETQVTFQIDLRAGETRGDVFLLHGNPAARAPDDDPQWGTVDEGLDGFQNEVLRVEYGLKRGTFGHMWGCQTAFVIRACDEDQFGGPAIPDSWAKSRNDVTYWEPNARRGPEFVVEADGPVYKRVRFFSPEKAIQHHPGDRVRRVTGLSQRVTFYRGCSFIEEVFENIPCGTTTTATPGGERLRGSDGVRRFGFFAHNFDSECVTWNGIGDDRETRGGWTADPDRARTDPRYRFLDDYTCHDHLILGVVNLRNGRGIGTCARNLQTAFFVDWSHERAGYSLWPKADGRMTSFLYTVEGGHGQAIARGRSLADPPEVRVVSTGEPLPVWMDAIVGG